MQYERLELLQRYCNLTMSNNITLKRIDTETQERKSGNQEMQRLYNYKVACLAEKQDKELSKTLLAGQTRHNS